MQNLASRVGDVAEGLVVNGEDVRAIHRVVKVFVTVLKYHKNITEVSQMYHTTSHCVEVNAMA